MADDLALDGDTRLQHTLYDSAHIDGVPRSFGWANRVPAAQPGSEAAPSGGEDPTCFAVRDPLPTCITLHRALTQRRHTEILAQTLDYGVNQVAFWSH